MGAESVGKVDTPEGVSRLEGFGKRVLNQSGPLRKQVLQQLDEALSTGSVAARVPLMQRAAEASLQAGSNATEQLEAQLGQRAGTPMGQSLLAGARTQGALTAGQVPTDFITPFVSSAPNVVGGFQNLAIGALTGGTQMRLDQEMFNDEQSAAFFRDLKDSLKSLASMGMGENSYSGPTVGGTALGNYNPGASYGGGFTATQPVGGYRY